MDFEEVTTIIALFISAIVAIGTLTLAIFAFRQVKNVSKDQKTRQIYEIIEWAKSAIEWDFTQEDRDRVENSNQPWSESFLVITNHMYLIMNMLRIGHIIDKASPSLKAPALNPLIENLLTQLLTMESHLVGLRNQIDFASTEPLPPNFKIALEVLMDHRAKLRQAGEDVMSEAAELL